MINGIVKVSNYSEEIGLGDLPYCEDLLNSISVEFFKKSFSDLCPIEKAHAKAAVVNMAYNELQKGVGMACLADILSKFLKKTHTLGRIENIR